MKKLTLILAFLIASVSLTSCKREGFKESLGQRENLNPVKIEAEKDNQQEEKSESTPSIGENLTIDFETTERNGNNLYIAYSLPKKDGVHDEAVSIISEKIESTLDEVAGVFDLSKEGSFLSIVDSVGAITEDVISLFYEGEYTNPAVGKPTKFAFGLNFNARTGGQYTISQIMKPHTMATLIMDEQSSTILGKEEDVKKKREELASQGMSALADRIVAADSQMGVDNLFTFSFYLEKGNLVAILPSEGDSGDPTYIQIMNDKV